MIYKITPNRSSVKVWYIWYTMIYKKGIKLEKLYNKFKCVNYDTFLFNLHCYGQVLVHGKNILASNIYFFANIS